MKAVLYSIKPKYVQKILNGVKTFEYRKTIYLDPTIRNMFIYATSPLQKVVAKCEIVRVLSDSPNMIWKKTKCASGISKDEFFSYFANARVAYAIQIKNVFAFEKEKCLEDFGITVAPQSFIYVEDV